MNKNISILANCGFAPLKALLTGALFMGGILLLNACSDEYGQHNDESNGPLVPLTVTAQLPAGVLTPGGDGTNPAVRTTSPNDLTTTSQVMIEIEYPGMDTDKGISTGIYTLTTSPANDETGVISCTLVPFEGLPTSADIKNANTLRVPAAGHFTLRIHGMAGEGFPISHIEQNASLDASGKLALGALKMADAHIAVKVEGAYGEGLLPEDIFEVTYSSLYPAKTVDHICQWLNRPEGTNTDGSGLGNYWLLSPDNELQATAVNMDTEMSEGKYAAIATPSMVKKGTLFLTLRGKDNYYRSTTSADTYAGKTFRVLTDKDLSYEAGKSYTYTLQLATTTATIIDVKIADWIPQPEADYGNQPGIYTAQDFIDFATAWNTNGKAGIGNKKYSKWMNYADTVKLMNDIELPTAISIGNESNPFTAIFDGNGQSIAANGTSLFGNVAYEGLIQALIRKGSISANEGGIAKKNAGILVSCLNCATIDKAGAGIVANNIAYGRLYGCTSVGTLLREETSTGKLTIGAGIATSNLSGYSILGCYYLSSVDDGKKVGTRAIDIKTMNAAVPAINNGPGYLTYYSINCNWKFIASNQPNSTLPYLSRGQSEYMPGIYIGQDLANFATEWNSKGNDGSYTAWKSGNYITLYNDINLDNATNFAAIGTEVNPFRGSANNSSYHSIYFEGNQHTVTYNGGALFDQVGVNANIKELCRAGSIKGIGQGGIAITNEGYIRKCTNMAEVKDETSAGIVTTNKQLVEYCTNQARVSSKNSAGIAGTNEKYIIACTNTGEINGKYSAGIAYGGTESSGNYLVACINTGAISGEFTSGITTNYKSSTTIHVISCINSRIVSGNHAAAIAPKNDNNNPTTACYYRSMQTQNAWGTAVPDLSNMNNTDVIKALNQGLINWNTSNSNACIYHYKTGYPATTTVPTLTEGVPTPDID